MTGRGFQKQSPVVRLCNLNVIFRELLILQCPAHASHMQACLGQSDADTHSVSLLDAIQCGGERLGIGMRLTLGTFRFGAFSIWRLTLGRVPVIPLWRETECRKKKRVTRSKFMRREFGGWGGGEHWQDCLYSADFCQPGLLLSPKDADTYIRCLQAKVESHCRRISNIVSLQVCKENLSNSVLSCSMWVGDLWWLPTQHGINLLHKMSFDNRMDNILMEQKPLLVPKEQSTDHVHNHEPWLRKQNMLQSLQTNSWWNTLMKNYSLLRDSLYFYSLFTIGGSNFVSIKCVGSWGVFVQQKATLYRQSSTSGTNCFHRIV